MAVIMKQTMPNGVPIQMLDAVTAEMDAKAKPPAGLIVHTHYEQDGEVHVLDVWDSEQSYRSFAAERLRPATEKIAAQNGMQAEPPQEQLIEVHDFVLGS
ncbi:MAG: hypothetical protein JO147_09130 [Actinobacteria bacterium]|nr:hypothetical protein [Actinomycetota bacterium]